MKRFTSVELFCALLAFAPASMAAQALDPGAYRLVDLTHAFNERTIASIDYGRSRDFMVHRVATVQNVPGLENLTSLDQLPAVGATVIALPMKIEGGTGGPVRAIALVPKQR